jgi:putative transposase
MQGRGLSERRSCGLVGQARTTQRYETKPKDDGPVRDVLRALTKRWPRFGLPRLTYLVREELGAVNHKRIERVYRESGMQLPRRRKGKRRGAGRLGPHEAPNRPNASWSMDFIMDSLADGRKFRNLVIIDAFTRECLAIEIDTSLSGERVARVLRRLAEVRGLPEAIVQDNGSEFTSKAMFTWSRDAEVELQFIAPGKPMQNGHCESFNGKFRDECLSRHYFPSLDNARHTIEAWRKEYNEERPHSAIGYQTPEAFKLAWERKNNVHSKTENLSHSLVPN